MELRKHSNDRDGCLKLYDLGQSQRHMFNFVVSVDSRALFGVKTSVDTLVTEF